MEERVYGKQDVRTGCGWFCFWFAKFVSVDLCYRIHSFLIQDHSFDSNYVGKLLVAWKEHCVGIGENKRQKGRARFRL